jgi:class 3 adenylate cyclase
MGAETARMLDGAADLTPIGAISVKGRTQPVDAFRVRST